MGVFETMVKVASGLLGRNAPALSISLGYIQSGRHLLFKQKATI